MDTETKKVELYPHGGKGKWCRGQASNDDCYQREMVWIWNVTKKGTKCKANKNKEAFSSIMAVGDKFTED